jgi:endogenous inhibitor of DNA gyrase (YacG/DUF329 family)
MIEANGGAPRPGGRGVGIARHRGTTCPTCADATAWADNPYRPFCSLACRLIDLGIWLDERYRIAGPERGGDDPNVP